MTHFQSLMNTHHVEQSDIERMLPTPGTRCGCLCSSACQPMSGELLRHMSNFVWNPRGRRWRKRQTHWRCFKGVQTGLTESWPLFGCAQLNSWETTTTNNRGELLSLSVVGFGRVYQLLILVVFRANQPLAGEVFKDDVIVTTRKGRVMEVETKIAKMQC